MASNEPTSRRFFVLDDGMFGPHDTKFDDVEPVNLGDAPECPECHGAGYCTIHIIESWFSWPKAVKARCSRCKGRGWYLWR